MPQTSINKGRKTSGRLGVLLTGGHPLVSAALKLLRTYYTKYGCITIRQIICRWAPETENQVDAYIKTVCRLTQLGADTPLPPMKAETKTVWCDLVLAMASVECGLTAEGRDSLRLAMSKAWAMV